MKVETSNLGIDIRKSELEATQTTVKTKDSNEMAQATLAEDVVEIGGGGGSWVPPSKE